MPPGIWYESAVRTFLTKGALDRSTRHFRPGELATRAEVVKLFIDPSLGIVSRAPRARTFDDVDAQAWYARYFEEAASRVWVRGDGNCAGSSHPCTARPTDTINRAEMAVLIARAYALPSTGSAPDFVDNAERQWYYRPIQIMADHCILMSDPGSARIHPSRPLNRAEVVTMLYRALHNPRYGECAAEMTEKEEFVR